MSETAAVGPAVRLGLRLTLLVSGVVLVLVPFLLIVLDVVLRGPLSSLDQRLAEREHSYVIGYEAAVDVAGFVTHLGSTAVLTAVVAVGVIVLLLVRRHRQALFLLVSAVLGVALNNLVKVLVGRSRPLFDVAVAVATGKSFPSGHAMNSTVVYGSLLVILLPSMRAPWHRVLVGTVTAVLVVVIAASRVVLGVHFMSDVIGGIILGSALVLGTTAAFSLWRHEGGRLPTVVEQAPTTGEAVPDRSEQRR